MPKRDPNKPRGRVSGYAYFLRACRQEQKKNRPHEQLILSKFSKSCAEKWKGLSANKKKKFNALSAKDGIRYRREMKHYQPPSGEGKKRKKKDPNAPKRPQSAFFLFCADRRARLMAAKPQWNVGRIAKELGKLWGVASNDVKQKYSKKAEKEKLKYNRAMAQYKKKHEQAGKANERDESSDSDTGSDSSAEDSD